MEKQYTTSIIAITFWQITANLSLIMQWTSHDLGDDTVGHPCQSYSLDWWSACVTSEVLLPWGSVLASAGGIDRRPCLCRFSRCCCWTDRNCCCITICCAMICCWGHIYQSHYSHTNDVHSEFSHGQKSPTSGGTPSLLHSKGHNLKFFIYKQYSHTNSLRPGMDSVTLRLWCLLPLYWVFQRAVAAGAVGGAHLAVSYGTPGTVARTKRTQKCSNWSRQKTTLWY